MRQDEIWLSSNNTEYKLSQRQILTEQSKHERVINRTESAQTLKILLVGIFAPLFIGLIHICFLPGKKEYYGYVY